MTTWKTCLVLFTLTLTNSREVSASDIRAATKDPPLYPFLRDAKWGYIDASGNWVIEPRFDRCLEIFESDRVRVWQGDRWGYINRRGDWLAKPQFTSAISGIFTDRYECVAIGKRWGILEDSAKLLLPVKYDDIVLFKDRAWIRDAQKLGVFSLDGHWILKPSIDWPTTRQMPIPTDGRASWFSEGAKWGLLSNDGKVLFKPQFLAHKMGRKEAEGWTHPEGVDFENGRAWVVVDGEYWLISDDGKVLSRQTWKRVRKWKPGLYIFYPSKGKAGLVSRSGEIVLEPKFSEIRDLNEGMAVVVVETKREKPNGESETSCAYGYIDENGKVVVEPGIYVGFGVPNGGQTELAPFAEGRAPVWNNAPNKNYSSDPWAGFIDKTGALIIPERFRQARPFSEGMAAVSEQIPGRNSGSYYDYQWGYVDRAGQTIIAPQFGNATPFCRGRAWVLKHGGKWDEPQWAMIDTEGNVRTEFSFEPPEKRNGWLYNEKEKLQKSRWRGDLAVITRGDFHNGLATSDGKILFEPVYNRIGELHDGVAVAVDSRGRDEQGNVTFVTSLLTEDGQVLAHDKYTDITDFKDGVAWATHRWTDHKGPYQREGWGLIDTSAKELSELKYIRAWWIWSKDYHYTDKQFPSFYDALAPVVSVENYKQYGEKIWLQNNWGYINRSGKIVAWHERGKGR